MDKPGSFSEEEFGKDVKLSAEHLKVQRLRKNGALLPLQLNAFTFLTVINLPPGFVTVSLRTYLLLLTYLLLTYFLLTSFLLLTYFLLTSYLLTYYLLTCLRTYYLLICLRTYYLLITYLIICFLTYLLTYFLNFSSQNCLLFVPKMSPNFMSHTVQSIYIALAWIL